MTREEAIEFIAQSVKSDVDMAKVADAIKALERDSIIDKIRAEMEDILIIHQDEERIYQQIKAIIDKYRAGSEGQIWMEET